MMKQMAYVFMVSFLVGLVACGSGVTGSRSVSLESATGGQIIEGTAIDPDEAIEVQFASEPGTVLAAMICYDDENDTIGEVVDVTVVPTGEFSVKIIPTAGAYPQKKTCILNLNAFGEFSVWTLNTGCSVSDDFTNSKTLDLAAAEYEQGDGCWKKNNSPASIEMLSDVLFIGDLAQAPPINFGQLIFKRISGANYNVSLDVSDVLYEFDQGLGRPEAVNYFVIIGSDIPDFDAEGESAPFVAVGYSSIYDNLADIIDFRCLAISSNGLFTQIENCGDGSQNPDVGFDRNGNIFTPYYSFDGGDTKQFFQLLDGGSSYDMSATLGAEADLDAGIMIIGDRAGVFGAVVIDDFIVTGDARFVDALVQ